MPDDKPQVTMLMSDEEILQIAEAYRLSIIHSSRRFRDIEELTVIFRQVRDRTREATLQAIMELVYAHSEHGEFAHGGRHECVDAIYEEMRKLTKEESHAKRD